MTPMIRSAILARTSGMTLAFTSAVLVLAIPVSGQNYDLSWYTLDGGGATFSTGGTFQLGGTIGQPDAGSSMNGGTFTLTGGFWTAGLGSCTCPGDFDGDGARTGDDIQRFVNCYLAAGSGCACADLTGDGILDANDLSTFVSALLAQTPCP